MYICTAVFVSFETYPIFNRKLSEATLYSHSVAQQFCAANFFSFYFKFLLDTCPFLGPLIPLFMTSGDVCSGFQSQSGFCLIPTLQRHTWYTFPEIHLWCDTSASVYQQHSSQLLFPHVCFRRGRMPDLNHIPPAWQADALTTQSQQPNLVYHVEKLRSFISPPYLIWSCYIIFIREKLSESCTFPVNNPIKSQIFLVKGAIIHQGRGGLICILYQVWVPPML